MSRKKISPECCPSDEDTDSDDDNDDDEDIQEDNLTFYPICCHTTTDSLTSYGTLADAVASDLRKNSFDLLQHLPSASNDQFFEKAIVCINKSRTFVSSITTRSNGSHGDGVVAAVVEGEELGKRLTDYLEASIVDINEEEEEEKFFRPFLIDDAFLLCMDDLQDLIQQRETVSSSGEKMTATEDDNIVAGTTNGELQMRIASLEEQLTRAKACITSLAVDENESTKKTCSAGQ